MISGIVLAAGASSRMGRAKQLLPFGSSTVLGCVLQAAAASGLGEVVVVLGENASEIRRRADLRGVSVLTNPQPRAGLSSSIRTGLHGISGDAQGAVFLLGDQPLVDASVVNALLDAFRGSGAPLVVPEYAGHRGNPVLVGRCLFPQLAAVRGDRGARGLIRDFPHLVRRVPVDTEAVLVDIDTQRDYLEALAQAL